MITFQLDPAQHEWVQRTLASLTTDQLIGQVMCPYLDDSNAPAWWGQLADRGIEPGAVMLTRGARAELQAQSQHLQDASGVPLLIAANLESGIGSLVEGEGPVATPLALGKIGSREAVVEVGAYCAAAGQDLGVNWTFSPVADLSINPANPITGYRAFGSHPDRVGLLVSAFIEGVQAGGMAACAKHFPGDGVDDRDQHLSASTNGLSADDWWDTFGRVYRSAIDSGVQTIMVGHIAQPALALVAGATAEGATLPATLSPALIRVLRDDLGFDGLVTTDATTMAAFTGAVPRREGLPSAIEAGCDMLLGFIDIEEDFAILRDAVADGRLSHGRLTQAVRRVLQLKAALGLTGQGGSRTRPSPDPLLSSRLAARSATIVRDANNLLPLQPDVQRVLVYVIGDQPTTMEPLSGLGEAFAEELRQRGRAVTMRPIPGEGRALAEERRLQLSHDLVIYFANHKLSERSNGVRISWSPAKGPDAPRHAEARYLLVSVADPDLGHDLPAAQTVINVYTPSRAAVFAALDLLCPQPESLAQA